MPRPSSRPERVKKAPNAFLRPESERYHRLGSQVRATLVVVIW
jgi:hypothetical protein